MAGSAPNLWKPFLIYDKENTALRKEDRYIRQMFMKKTTRGKQPHIDYTAE